MLDEEEMNNLIKQNYGKSAIANKEIQSQIDFDKSNNIDINEYTKALMVGKMNSPTTNDISKIMAPQISLGNIVIPRHSSLLFYSNACA